MLSYQQTINNKKIIKNNNNENSIYSLFEFNLLNSN